MHFTVLTARMHLQYLLGRNFFKWQFSFWIRCSVWIVCNNWFSDQLRLSNFIERKFLFGRHSLDLFPQALEFYNNLQFRFWVDGLSYHLVMQQEPKIQPRIEFFVCSNKLKMIHNVKKTQNVVVILFEHSNVPY